MDIKTLEQRVCTVMAKQLGITSLELSPDFDVIVRGYADSLDLVELVMALEEEFELEVSDNEAESVRPVTPANVIAFFAGKLGLQYDAPTVVETSYKAKYENLLSRYTSLVTRLKDLVSSVDKTPHD